MSKSKKNNNGIYSRLLRYLAEIIIIFLGITISFLFERWREENHNRKELIEFCHSLARDANIAKVDLEKDLTGSEEWITNLDSLRIQRDNGNFSASQVGWFYKLLIGKDYGLFDSKSPTYLSGINNGMIDKLPDSIQSQVYQIYQVRFQDFQFLYNMQLETIKTFRHQVMIPSEYYLYHTDTNSVAIDIKKFTNEIKRPEYGNFINQMHGAEEVVYRTNINTTKALTNLINSLRNYSQFLASQ